MKLGMPRTVLGLFDELPGAQEAVRELVRSGVDAADIGFVANERDATPRGAHSDKDEGGALAGAGTGAAIGGAAGLALAAAPLAIPGIGPLLAAGPLAAALGGAGLGALAGGAIGGLVRLGLPEEQAHYFAEGVRRGGILVSVAAKSDALAGIAVTVMKKHGAVDVESRAAEWKRGGWAGRFEGR
ncbi:MAG TPA: hypothetical protein VM489_04570 [Burkholderiales bacterium]|nr:hypothetical protein [Burkholderiales bacterium]